MFCLVEGLGQVICAQCHEDQSEGDPLRDIWSLPGMGSGTGLRRETCWLAVAVVGVSTPPHPTPPHPTRHLKQTKTHFSEKGHVSKIQERVFLPEKTLWERTHSLEACVLPPGVTEYTLSVLP